MTRPKKGDKKGGQNPHFYPEKGFETIDFGA